MNKQRRIRDKNQQNSSESFLEKLPLEQRCPWCYDERVGKNRHGRNFFVQKEDKNENESKRRRGIGNSFPTLKFILREFLPGESH